MKKIIILLFITLNVLASVSAMGSNEGIPLIKSLTIGNEEYVRREIMKCKDVESVEVIPRNLYKDDYVYYIYVYLTDNRCIAFAGEFLENFLYNKKENSISLWQINSIFPVMQAYKAEDFTGKIGHYYTQLLGGLEINKINKVFQNINFNNNNILEIINNFGTVYDLINNLPELPLNTPHVQDFDVIYEGKAIFPEEFENEIPFSIIEQHENINTGFVDKTVKIFEERYKFYKIPVERVITEFKFKHLKPEYGKQE